MLRLRRCTRLECDVVDDDEHVDDNGGSAFDDKLVAAADNDDDDGLLSGGLVTRMVMGAMAATAEDIRDASRLHWTRSDDDDEDLAAGLLFISPSQSTLPLPTPPTTTSME